MSKFKDVILESLTNEDNIQNLLNIIKPELTQQCPGLEIVDSEGMIKIKLNNSAYTIKLKPVSITTEEEEEFNENEEQPADQEQNMIDPNTLASLDNLSKSTNPQIANSAKNTLSTLNKNIAAIGTALTDRTNKILNNIKQ